MALLERHIFVALVWVSTAAAFVAHLSSGGGRVVASAGVILALAIWLHLVSGVHRWVDGKVAGGRLVVTTVGLYVAFAVLVAIDASYLFMLFGVFSFTFGFSNDVRRSAVLSGVLTAMWIAAWIFHDLPAGAIATPVFVWAVANAINVLSSRISRQNSERGELIERLNRTRAELANAERERGVLEERSRISREIHDTLAQGFTSVVLLSEAMQSQLETMQPEVMERSLGLISSTARENLDEARRLIAAQPPSLLDDRSLDGALALLAADVRRRTGAVVEVLAPGGLSLGGSEEVVLLRVAQEACNNIVKHADARTVEISLVVDGDTAVLRVADDGCGFDSARPSETSHETLGALLSGGSGLGFMADRATELDGEVRIESSVDRGTTVTVSIPIVGRVL